MVILLIDAPPAIAAFARSGGVTVVSVDRQDPTFEAFLLQRPVRRFDVVNYFAAAPDDALHDWAHETGQNLVWSRSASDSNSETVPSKVLTR